MDAINDVLTRIDRLTPHALPDLRRGKTLFVGSDFSGDHKTADFLALSFLFADLASLDSWENIRTETRREFLSDGRRISYKALGDRKRRHIMLSFLQAANTIHGIVVTILIDKRLPSLFWGEKGPDFSDPELARYRDWKPASLEKLLCAIHFCAFFVAGLSGERQDVLWFSDEDEIAPNDHRITRVAVMFANVLAHYLGHNMGHIRFGTTRSDDGSRSLEDLVSIPDLAAGMLVEVLTKMASKDILSGSRLLKPMPQSIPTKAKNLMLWFSENHHPLKRLVLTLEPGSSSGKLLIKHVDFATCVEM